MWKQYVFVGTPDCRLIAVDRKASRQVWETVTCESGLTISGAPRVGGDKVFIGIANMDVTPSRGHVDAFDAKTGRHLWRFYTIPGDPAKGFENPAMAMAAKTWGKPVGLGGGVAKLTPVCLGDKANGPARLLAFSLSGTATLPPVAPEPPFPKPPRPQPDSAAPVLKGRMLFAAKGCEDCHGPGAHRQVGPDTVPDLRRASAQVHEEFAAIVTGGLRRDKGMPVFAGQITPEELQALQAFILDQAWSAYENTERHP